MKVKLLRVGPIGTNCYILEDDQTNLAAVIDPGDEPELIAAMTRRAREEMPGRHVPE